MKYRIPKSQFEIFSPRIYYCQKAKKALEIDGNLEKSFWQDVPFSELFTDIEGDTKPEPRFSTRMKMKWDDNNLYIGAELMGDEIWGNVTKRDDVIFQDNDFEVFIDPDSDTHRYIEFEMNALNTVWDLLLDKPYRDKGCPFNSFDIKGLRTAVKIEGELNNPFGKNKRWCCEIVMPFESLCECNSRGKRPVNGDYWRINFSRVQWPVDIVDGRYIKRVNGDTGNILPEDNWVWSPMGVVDMHYPELWGFLVFSQGESLFEYPADEKTKWELRRFYYAQHCHFDETGGFARNSRDLLPESPLKEVTTEVNHNGLVLSCSSDDRLRNITIGSDGAVKITKIEKNKEI